MWKPNLVLAGSCQFCNADYVVQIAPNKSPAVAEHFKYSACRPCLQKVLKANAQPVPEHSDHFLCFQCSCCKEWLDIDADLCTGMFWMGFFIWAVCAKI